MTREQAKQLLPIIQAFSKGKTIQFKPKSKTHWFSITESEVRISFDINSCDYRIKPEPREFWIIMPIPPHFNHIATFDVPEQAELERQRINRHFNRLPEIIHVKEVIEE